MKSVKGIVDAWPARSNVEHNPFQSLLSNATASQGWSVREFSPIRSFLGSADIWHWHWPDGQFSHRSRAGAWVRLAALLVLLHRARLTRTPIVWTAHNIRGHEDANRSVEDRFWPIFHRHVSAVHYLSEASRAAAIERHPILGGKPYIVTPHGHYRDIYNAPLSKLAARVSLRIDEQRPTIVFFGKIRAYKGVTDLIRAFAETAPLDAQLIIAGLAVGEEADLVQAAASSDTRISLFLKLLSDEEIVTIVSAADVVVLPYKEVTNSGSAVLALSLNRPVLAANKGSIRELADEVGSEWVIAYDELTPQSLRSALDAATANDHESPDLEFCSWPRIGNDVSNLYDSIRPRKKRGFGPCARSGKA